MPQAQSYFYNAVGTIVRVRVLVIEEGKKLGYDYAHAYEEKVHEFATLVRQEVFNEVHY